MSTKQLDTLATADIPARDRLIVALDVPTAEDALQLVYQLRRDVNFFKVGLELFASGEGLDLIETLSRMGCRIFADLKLHDVPATVSRTIRQLNGRGIDFVTVHTERELMTAAVQAADDLKILAVTVLTSMNQASARDIGITGELDELILQRAVLAKQCGCHGVIASGREVEALKSSLGREFLVVTPGIRSSSESTHDQKRTVSARQAITAGADHIVVGRSIRDAEIPARAAAEILLEIQQACLSISRD